MSIASTLDQLHLRVRENRWHRYFAVFNRIALAAGFLPSGLQKVIGERFTVLPVNHPMGHFLDALYQTGYYYTFIGVMQVTAAVLLLIPRTATLGAAIYLPIILNICILTFAVRFDGSLVTSPLMVLACLYLLCWDYHKWQSMFPFSHSPAHKAMPRRKDLSNRFPTMFFAGMVATVLMVVLVSTQAYDIVPHNTISDCREQCRSTDNPDDCYAFCDCIHIDGQPLGKCLNEYNETVEDTVQTDQSVASRTPSSNRSTAGSESASTNTGSRVCNTPRPVSRHGAASSTRNDRRTGEVPDARWLCQASRRTAQSTRV